MLFVGPWIQGSGRAWPIEAVWTNAFNDNITIHCCLYWSNRRGRQTNRVVSNTAANKKRGCCPTMYREMPHIVNESGDSNISNLWKQFWMTMTLFFALPKSISHHLLPAQAVELGQYCKTAFLNIHLNSEQQFTPSMFMPLYYLFYTNLCANRFCLYECLGINWSLQECLYLPSIKGDLHGLDIQ